VRLDPAGTTTRQRLLTAMSETNDGLTLAGVTPSMSADTAADLVHAAPASAVKHDVAPTSRPEEPCAADVTMLRAIASSYRHLR
jgi:hypothetical protein